jgi:hypothetical protein
MAVIVTPPPVPPGDPAAQAPPTLSVTYYQQLATHISEVIGEVQVIIPRDTGVDQTSAFVKTHLNIPLKFLSTTVAAVELFAVLQATGKLDVDRARDTLQMLDAFRTTCYRAAAFLEDLVNALDARQADLAVECLEVYHVAQSIARDESDLTLTMWVESMGRDLGRRGPRPKKPSGPAPDTIPVPVSMTWVPEKPEGRNG